MTLTLVGAHLDGDGDQLPLLVQVEQAERGAQVRLLPVDHVGRDSVQNLVVQQVDASSLSHHGDAEVRSPSLDMRELEAGHSPGARAGGRSLWAGRGGACQRSRPSLEGGCGSGAAA